jgi:lysophospholipase
MANNRLKSAAGVAEDQLKAGAKKLQEQLVTVEKAAGKLASKAKTTARERLPAAADVKAEIPEVRRRLQQATASVTKRRRGGPGPAAAPSVAGPTSTSGSSTSSGSAGPSGSSNPDDSWTVADLRAEAKQRGLTGSSRKTKAELLAELGGRGASRG